jgi:hypothetical protein
MKTTFHYHQFFPKEFGRGEVHFPLGLYEFRISPGLTDRDGKKVYTGDVHRYVTESESGNDVEHVNVFAWLPERCCFAWVDAEAYRCYLAEGITGLEEWEHGVEYEANPTDTATISVVGNIYERPLDEWIASCCKNDGSDIEPEDCESCSMSMEEQGHEYTRDFTFKNGCWHCDHCDMPV